MLTCENWQPRSYFRLPCSHPKTDAECDEQMASMVVCERNANRNANASVGYVSIFHLITLIALTVIGTLQTSTLQPLIH